jgi:voltage-gated potassium channel
MAARDRIAELRALPLFAEVSDASIESIAAIATEIDVPAGQVLVQRNEPGSGMFVVLDGAVAVELRGKTVELGPGEFFGELSLLVPGATRGARVRASTASRCLAIGRRQFAELLESDHPLALAMLSTLAARMRDML